MNGSRFMAARGWMAIKFSLCFAALVLAASASGALAQETAAPATAPMASPAAGQPVKVEQKPGEQKPGGDAKKSDGEKKPDGTKPEDAAKEKKPDEPMPVRRPTEPPKPANPEELKVRPGADGKVTFSFKGQPWPAVLEWLADVSQMSLEWQEAPPGYLDLTTRRRYTVEEARDLINSILLGRGYTLLRNGEVLMVAKLKDLDASLVPRVTPEELDQRDEYELARVFFDLDRLQAEQLVEDLKPLLSTYGKITAMKTTNRIDVLETAGNLRRLRDTIGAEQSASGQDTMLKEFQLRHARAEVVIVTLEKLLGIESKKPAGPMNPEQMQMQMQQQQQMMEMQRNMAQQGGGKPKPAAEEAKVLLAVYERKNTIMASATPDKIAMIGQAIDLLDVPVNRSASPLQQMARVKSYRLVAVDPQVVVNLLKELGNLDPTTRLEVDAPNRVIIADAPIVDHLTIQALVEKIDGSARRIEVIQLSQELSAEYVAGSIEFLIRGPKQEERRSRYSWGWDPYGGGRSSSEQKDGGFQVEPDIENNRLLLRVNDVEFEEIRAFLVKLGEDPYRDPRGETMRVLRSGSGRQTDRLLKDIRQVWPSIRPSVPLEINDEPSDAAPSNRQPNGEEDNEAEKPPQPAPKVKPPAERSAAVVIHRTALTERVVSALAQPAALAQIAADDSQPADIKPTNEERVEPEPERQPSSAPQRSEIAPATLTPQPSSATITRGPNGLIFSSPDPATLDQLMRLAEELSAQDARFHIFPLKFTYAKDMAELLTTIFSEEGAKDSSGGRSRYVYIWDDPPPKEQKERGRLSKRPPLKFIPDPVTNTILVQGADDHQLVEIEELIKRYDRFEEPSAESVRQSEFITLKYAKAREVAEVLKEVFRDLLSPNDKALMVFNQQKAQQEQQNRPLFSYWDSEFGSNKNGDENLPRFKGLLSVGVDQRSNSLYISAPGRLLKSIKVMVQQLDAAAQPQEPVTKVVRMGGAITDPLIKEALRNFADPEAARRNGQHDRQQETTGNGNNGQQRNGNRRNGQNGQRNGVQPGGF